VFRAKAKAGGARAEDLKLSKTPIQPSSPLAAGKEAVEHFVNDLAGDGVFGADFAELRSAEVDANEPRLPSFSQGPWAGQNVKG
jgi:hypothetical protein